MEDVIKVYSYDVNKYGLPNGFSSLRVPHDDITIKDAIKICGLPAIYFFPQGPKTKPYLKFVDKEPIANKILKFI